MPIVTTEAFVLRSYKLGENDKIVVLFTRDFGKLRLVAKGSRKLKNRFGAALELFTRVRAIFHEKENRELLILDKAEILSSPFEKATNLRTDFFLFYFAELVHEFYPDREKNPAAFKVLLNIEHAMKKRQNLDFLARYVELQLLHSQGILSSVAFCSACARHFETLLERRYLGDDTGIYCKRCRGQESTSLSAQVIKSIDSFEKGAVDWVSTLPGRTLEELGSLNHLLITRFLGKELHSYQFRKELATE